MAAIERHVPHYYRDMFRQGNIYGMGDVPQSMYNIRHPVKHAVEEAEFKAMDAGSYVLKHKDVFTAAVVGIGVIGTIFLARRMIRSSATV